MTPQEIVKEVKHFSISDKLSIIQQISQNLIIDLKPKETKELAFDEEKRELTTDEKIGIVENLYGCLRAEGRFIPMTREEEREIILEHLLEKYS